MQVRACAQATSRSLGISAPEADAAATHAIVLGASVAGLLSAAALSEYVGSVTVLDKDAFVNERLSPDELKQGDNHAFCCFLLRVVALVQSYGAHSTSIIVHYRCLHVQDAFLGEICFNQCAAISLSWRAVSREGAQPQGRATIHSAAWLVVQR